MFFLADADPIETAEVEAGFEARMNSGLRWEIVKPEKIKFLRRTENLLLVKSEGRFSLRVAEGWRNFISLVRVSLFKLSIESLDTCAVANLSEF